jgi:hypothetical protein
MSPSLSTYPKLPLVAFVPCIDTTTKTTTTNHVHSSHLPLAVILWCSSQRKYIFEWWGVAQHTHPLGLTKSYEGRRVSTWNLEIECYMQIYYISKKQSVLARSTELRELWHIEYMRWFVWMFYLYIERSLSTKTHWWRNVTKKLPSILLIIRCNIVGQSI